MLALATALAGSLQRYVFLMFWCGDSFRHVRQFMELVYLSLICSAAFTRSIIIFLYSIPILLEISTVIAGGCRSSCDDASSRAVVCTVIKKTPCLLDLVVLNCFSLNPLHTCEKYRFNEIKTGNAGPYIIESTVTLNYRSCSRV